MKFRANSVPNFNKFTDRYGVVMNSVQNLNFYLSYVFILKSLVQIIFITVFSFSLIKKIKYISISIQTFDLDH